MDRVNNQRVVHFGETPSCTMSYTGSRDPLEHEDLLWQGTDRVEVKQSPGYLAKIARVCDRGFKQGIAFSYQLAGITALAGSACTVMSFVAPADLWLQTLGRTAIVAWIPETPIATNFLALSVNVCNPLSIALFGTGVVSSIIYAAYQDLRPEQTPSPEEAEPTSPLLFTGTVLALLSAGATSYLYMLSPLSVFFHPLMYTSLFLAAAAVVNVIVAGTILVSNCYKIYIHPQLGALYSR